MRKVAIVLVVLAAAIMVAPFFYMLSVSFMGETDLLRWPPPLLPATATLDNYAAALVALPYGRVLANTAILAGCVMLGQLLTSAAAGYALARMRFAGSNGVLAMLFGLLAVPTILLVIPRYLLMVTLGWVDTYPGLVSTELVSIWGILLMRQAFTALPREVEDAARLDGAGEWTVFWRVTLPLVRPAVLAIAVLAFVDQWRNFLWPLVITRSPRVEVAELALLRFHGAYVANAPYQMAAAVLVTLPVLIAGLVAQRYVMHGLRISGARARL
ncbi:MAG TPA: carbohydrate ABC transporter permease [Gemmatimonadales bacterium]|jgi:multiple sugar transport system permease protein